MQRMLDKHTVALILAGGSGSRMNSDKTKQNIEILGETVLHRTARAFDECASVDSIVVVTRFDEIDATRAMLADVKKLYSVVVGGKTRRESARCGFDAIPSEAEFVAIHDAARCLITPEMIDKVVEEAKVFGAASCVSDVVDTVKLEEGGFLVDTLDRSHLRLAQTPQVFSVQIYKDALENSEKNMNITDDNMMVERLGIKIRSVNTSSQNIKITTVDDLALAEFILEKRRKNV